MIGLITMAAAITILKVVRWFKLKATAREFGAVEVTEVVQVNPMQMFPLKATVDEATVHVPG